VLPRRLWMTCILHQEDQFNGFAADRGAAG